MFDRSTLCLGGCSLVMFVFALSGCGGGGGSSGGGGDPSTPSYTVSVSVSGNGSVGPSGPVQVNQGGDASFTLIPDSGYGASMASGCGGSLEGNVFTTGTINADCTVSITYAPLYTVSITVSGNGTTSPAGSLEVAEGTSAQISLLPDPDYLIDTATGCGGSRSGAGYTTGVITSNCTVTVAFKQLKRIYLNDTGVIDCGDYASSSYTGTHNNDVDCALAGVTMSSAGTDGDGDPVPAGQDALYGRDAQAVAGTLIKEGAGNGGFDFTKIDSAGNPLAASASSWDCVLDNVTGLTWEVKVDDPTDLRHKSHYYSWYNSDSGTNGGNEGYADNGACAGGTGCDTEKYVNDVNAAGLCGYSDWRLPSYDELLSIVDFGSSYPAIDTAYFPYTNSSGYWASTPSAAGADYVWDVDFITGFADLTGKDVFDYVRLVRGEQ